jgi:Flp pilus assembly protein TadB
MDSDGTHTASAPAIDRAQRLRTSNRRTAIILLSIAICFFVGIIATKWMGGPTVGIGVVGAAVLLFLVVAIGRNLRSKR